jgi:hypothetical protein
MIRRAMVRAVGFSRGISIYPQTALPSSWRGEIRDRLNVILGFAELLSNDPAASLRNRHFAENIRAAGVRLLYAVEQTEPIVSGRRKRSPRVEDTS